MSYPVSSDNYGYVVRPKGAKLALIVITLLLTACGLLGGSGGDQTSKLGHQTRLEPNSEAMLKCSQECSDRGWCGVNSDQRPVVLGSAIDPSSLPHDRVFPQDTRVNVDFIAVADVELVSSGERSQLPFYYITSLADGRSAWIAGWCISAP